QKEKTYNSRCSPVVTHLTTNLPLISLTLGERTGSRIFQWIWSYVLGASSRLPYHQLVFDAGFSIPSGFGTARVPLSQASLQRSCVLHVMMFKL
ncbi:hypothetical protein BBK36DRAFT_1131279, partial [Trichoderma citrinoviride]